MKGYASRKWFSASKPFVHNFRNHKCACNSIKTRELYPQKCPIKSSSLQVSQIHIIHYEVYGNPNGKPVLVVHGGPGAACWTKHSRFFDMDHYLVILVDQRGCGKSTPKGCLVDNDIWHLISDFEEIRAELEIERWLLFGGSWGTTLALAYAQQHPESVSGMILRAVCLMRKQEIMWMFGGGCQSLNPYSWDAFVASLHEDDRRMPLWAYYKLLTSEDNQISLEAAKRWQMWDMSVFMSSTNGDNIQVWEGESWQQEKIPARAAHLRLPPNKIRANASPNVLLSKETSHSVLPSGASVRSTAQNFKGGKHVSQSQAQAILEAHYSLNLGFLSEKPILQGIEKIRHIPCVAIHGRFDFVCPIRTASDLLQEWPEMELRVVSGAGHSMYDPRIQHEILETTDRMKQLKY